MKTDRFSGRRARKGLANKLFFLMTGVTFGVAGACSYDYKALMGPDMGPDSGSGGSGGRSGSGGSVVGTGSGGDSGTGSGGTLGSGGATATGGSSATGGATATGSGGAVGTGGAGTGSGGATATGGTAGSATTGTGGAGTGGMLAATGGRGGTSSAGGAATGGSSGTGGAGTGGAATGGAASGGAPGTGGAGTGGSATGGATADPDLVLWYRFEEMSGIAVADSATAASTPHAGMLATFGTGGEALFSAVHQVGNRSVALTSNGSTGGGYVILPSLMDLAPNAITLSIWVQVTTAQRWQRVFDLGNTTTTNMALTTQDGTDSVRFVIRVNGGAAEQLINTTSKLTLSVWHHLVVVLRAGVPYTGEIFVDGVSAGTNNAMTLHALDLGATANNFLGRSQFAADPYWSGMFDDFRVYRRALTATEVAAVMLQR